jgi:hypothetical protein
MSRVVSAFPVKPSRAFYYVCWRLTTEYDWRKANRESRHRHVKERRAYDQRRYWAKRLPVLHDEAIARDALLERMGCFDPH